MKRIVFPIALTLALLTVGYGYAKYTRAQQRHDQFASRLQNARLEVQQVIDAGVHTARPDGETANEIIVSAVQEALSDAGIDASKLRELTTRTDPSRDDNHTLIQKSSLTLVAIEPGELGGFLKALDGTLPRAVATNIAITRVRAVTGQEQNTFDCALTLEQSVYADGRDDG